MFSRFARRRSEADFDSLDPESLQMDCLEARLLSFGRASCLPTAALVLSASRALATEVPLRPRGGQLSEVSWLDALWEEHEIILLHTILCCAHLFCCWKEKRGMTQMVIRSHADYKKSVGYCIRKNGSHRCWRSAAVAAAVRLCAIFGSAAAAANLPASGGAWRAAASGGVHPRRFALPSA